MKTRISALMPLAAALAVGCREAPPPKIPPSTPLDVRFAGCVELSRSGVCAVGAEALRLWVPSLDTPAIDVDSTALAPTIVRAADGQRITVSVPPVASGGATLTVTAGTGRWTLKLVPAPEAIDLSAPTAADHVAARLLTAQGPERARSLRAAGRLAARRGDLDGAVVHLTAAEEAAKAAGVDSEARLAGVTRAHMRFMQGRLDDARTALAGLEPPLPGDARGAYATRYAHAVVARASGDLRAAARDLALAAHHAEQVGLDREARAAQIERGVALIDLGRTGEAISVLGDLARTLPEDTDPCTRGDVATNLGWALIRAGRPAIEQLDGALVAYHRCDRQVEHRQATARINLAVAHLAGDDARAAADALESIADEGAGAEVAAWRLIVSGRLARRAGDRARARALFEQLEARARAAGLAGLRWRAHVEQGLTAEGACDWTDAIDQYRRAEALLFDASLNVAADGGRTRFLADRGESAALLVRALVSSARPAEAFDAARRARRRGLMGFSQHARLDGLPSAQRSRWDVLRARYVDGRAALDTEVAEDWSRSAEALAALEPARSARRAALSALLDEMATLAGGALTADAPLPPLRHPTVGWFSAPTTRSQCSGVLPSAAYVFSALGAKVAASPLASLDDPFGPVAEALAGALSQAERLDLMPTGTLRDRPLHLERIGGVPLIEQVPVAWRLDGPPRAPRPSGGRQALLVVDPRLDLAEARREGDAVAARLTGAGWTVSTLRGGEATHDAVRQGLGDVDLFHYAGHARAEGIDGWQSAFLLAGGPMTVGDVLAAPAGPGFAVLAGCETGRAPGDVSGISLAHALLAVGTAGVVATVRPVADADAAAFSGAFYAAYTPEAPLVAWRRALAGVRSEARGAFRLWVP